MSQSEEETNGKDIVSDKLVEMKWVDLDVKPVFFCNQFLIQHHANEFVLTLGTMVPPPLFKAPTEQQAEKLKEVNVNTVVRVGMSPDRMLQLIEILQINFKKYQATHGIKE